MQKFYTDTLISRFIKYMLSQVHIPLITTVNDSYPIHKDLTYLYNNQIIKCTESGTIKYKDDENGQNPSVLTFPSFFLFPETGYTRAAYDILVSDARPLLSPNTYYSHNSTTTYYDSETHKHLGNYLRYIRDSYDLNLMPYYNCYSSKQISGITLNASSDNRYTLNNNYNKVSMHKLFVVPIKFNCKYTVAIESNTELIMQPVIWNNETFLSASDGTPFLETNTLISGFKTIAKSSFNSPWLYSVDLSYVSDSNYFTELYHQENNLYLLIQTSANNDSSLVVIEGDYTNTENVIKCNNIETYSPEKNLISSTPVQKYSDVYNLSLLKYNTGESYPFSTRLIEYLLGHVIHQYETLTGNIKRSQHALSKTTNYNANNCTPGVWSETISHHVNVLSQQLLENHYLVDIDGNIHKDVEEMFWKQGGIDLAAIR